MENEAPTYSALYVFGDSLSDNGAIFTLTGGTVPPLELTGTDLNGDPVDFAARGIFFDQKFTNGDVLADVSADELNIDFDTSTYYDDFSGSNFAVGGATATDLTAIGGTASSTFAEQVALFQGSIAGLENTDGLFLENAAASIFIGLNDLGALGGAATVTGTIDQDVINAGVNAILADLTTQTQAIAASGIGTIILNQLPSGAFFPNANPLIDALGPGTEEAFDAVAATINQGIAALAQDLRDSGTIVEVIDLFSLAKEVQADASAFGFQTLDNALPNSDAENTLLISDVPIDEIGFIDSVHFTAELHEVFGAFQAKTIGNIQLDGDSDAGIHIGGFGNETIFARDGNDLINAEAGDDIVFAGEGDDNLFAGDGADLAFGGTGADLIVGEAGDDVLSGGSDVDFLLGGDGGSVLAGGDANDVLIGGSGIDVLIGGAGNDVMAGRDGDDIAIYDASLTADNADTFYGGAGTDTLLVVSETTIDDVDAFLSTAGLVLVGVENVLTITEAELDVYDFGEVSGLIATADLYGLI